MNHRIHAEHVIARAFERFRINLTYADVVRLNGRIVAGEGVAFDLPTTGRTNGRGRGVLIRLDSGEILPLVYVPGIGCTTVLPRNSLQLKRAMIVSGLTRKSQTAQPSSRGRSERQFLR